MLQTRITIDLGQPQLLTLLRLESAQTGKAIKEIMVEALQGYFSSKKENKTLLKLAETAFAEWDNPHDAAYDQL